MAIGTLELDVEFCRTICRQLDLLCQRLVRGGGTFSRAYSSRYISSIRSFKFQSPRTPDLHGIIR
jgi:hypothetical protein